ncbi:MAG: hypothetical protein V4448_16660 [Pseudomonadota bacterium]
MIKNIAIAVLLLCVGYLSVTVVRLENFHYASLVGMCPEFKTNDTLQSVKHHSCLHATETRTNPIWHLIYALSGE